MATRTLLIVGQNPGFNEDQEDQPFSPNGDSGKIVREAIIPLFPEDMAVYLSNTARCYTPPDATIKDKCYATCARTYLLPDLLALSEASDHLFVLALGAPAARHIAALLSMGQVRGSKKLTLNDLKKTQGVQLPLPNGRVIQLYVTNHPAAALRNPNTLKTISIHLSQALRHISGIRIPRTTPHIVQPFMPPSTP